MPHPALVAWHKHRAGSVSVARDRLGRYHILSNDAGRAELADRLTRFEEIDCQSTTEFPLANPPQAPVDTNMMAKDPAWFSRLKIAGGGANAAGVLWRLEDGTEFRFDRKELADVLRKPNRGHAEWWCDSPHSLWVCHLSPDRTGKHRQTGQPMATPSAKCRGSVPSKFDARAVRSINTAETRRSECRHDSRLIRAQIRSSPSPRTLFPVGARGPNSSRYHHS